MTRVLVIGLDGATFDVMGARMDDGTMPTLSALERRGTSATLESTVPPATGPSWLTMATGLRPETTGVFDFVTPTGEDMRLRPIGSRDYAGRAVWDVLTARDRRSVVLNFPMLLPPYPLNGAMTAGVGATPDDDYTYPPEMRARLNELAGGRYDLVVPYHDAEYDDAVRFKRETESVLDVQARVASAVLREQEWDLAWVVLAATDWYQHRLWSGTDGGAAADPAFWSRVDDAVARLLDAADDDTSVLIVSDHGFGANTAVFRLNAWLMEQGLLVPGGQSDAVADRARRAAWSAVRGAARVIGVHKVAPRLYDRGRRRRGESVLGVRGTVDFERSAAFDPGHTIPFGGIYVNRMLRPDPGARLDLARDIRERLLGWGAERGIAFEAVLPGEKGPSPDGVVLPDLLVSANDWSCVMLKDELDAPLWEERTFSPRHSGSHRMNGVLLAAGARIGTSGRGRGGGPSVVDVAPTILHLLDEGLPESMEGRVLTEILDPDFLLSHAVRSVAEGQGAAPDLEDGPDDEAIRKRLEDLGYL